MAERASAADDICSLYLSMIEALDVESVAQCKTNLDLPFYPAEQIISLCNGAKPIFASEQVSLNLIGPIVIVGDLHGHLLDLLRIIQFFGPPEKHKLLFLGDIVDRGEFSLETITLVLALKCKWPQSVFVIRGNHEFDFLCQRCGFQAEVKTVYGQNNQVYEAFLDAFSELPLTAVICSKILCVHGGLGPSWFSIRQATKIERPIREFGDDFVDAMLWSDPNPAVEFFEPSRRGTGFLFGENCLLEFMDANGIELLVRAHECVNTGCQFMFNGKLVTVFSASNYCGLVSNNAAVLVVNQDGCYEAKQFVPLQYLKRTAVNFMKVVNGKMVAHAKPIPGSKSSMQIPGLPGLPKLPPLGGNRPVMPPLNSDPRTHKPTGRARWNEAIRAHMVRTPR